MNRPAASLLAVVSFSTLCVLPLSAQAQPSTTPQNVGTGAAVLDTGAWTVTPFAGVGFSGDLDSGTGDFGVAAGYNWRPQISLEMEFSTMPSSEAGGFVEVDSSLWTVTGNMLYHFNKRPYVPYAAVGLGVGHGSVDIDSNDPFLRQLDSSDSNLVINFGGGVNRKFGDAVGVRGDLRYFIGGDLVPDYLRLSVGLTFTLGDR